MAKKKKYPTTHVVHWPTGPVECCEKHANGLVNLSRLLGSHVGVTMSIDEDAECMNCREEDTDLANRKANGYETKRN